MNLDLLNRHVRVHGGRLLNCLSESFVVIDRLAVTLDRHLLFDPGLAFAVSLGRVRRRLDCARLRRYCLRGHDLALKKEVVLKLG